MQRLWWAVCVCFWATTALAYDDVIGVRYIRCHDGDTCLFSIDHVPDVFGRNMPVRLSGIDTPEVNAVCVYERQLAQEAKTFLNRYLQSARVLALQSPKRDKYFRLNATIMADGVNVNQLMMDRGYAVAYAGGTKTHHWCR